MAHIKLPRALALWTVDQVAECINVPTALSGKLWQFKERSTVQTPLGGDGSNGTVETPAEQLGVGNDKLQHWWHELTDAEKWAILVPYRKEYGHQS